MSLERHSIKIIVEDIVELRGHMACPGVEDEVNGGAM
jgi:hypothetical protein